MVEFESSGLRQNEFCRKHGLALGTLQRQLKKRRLDAAATVLRESEKSFREWQTTLR